MKVNINKIKEISLDTYCELIRMSVFKEEFGCYSCFELEDSFKKLDPKKDLSLKERTLLAGCFAKDEEEIKSMRVFWSDEYQLKVAWLWDGDGTLLFVDVDNNCYVNSDCKKTYGWQLNPNWVEELSENFYDIKGF